MKNTRLAAFETLYKILSNDAFSNIAVDSALEGEVSQNRAFTAALVYGVIERKLTLDYLLSFYLTGKTKPKVKIILYIGAYQLVFMDKVPASAAVNEAVKLADEVGCGYYKNLINAVLRKVDAEFASRLQDVSLSIRYSCPKPLVNMLLKQYGKEQTEAILKASLGRPPVYAVANTLYVDTEELEYELLDEGVICETDGELVKILSPFDVSASRAFQHGLFHIEDKSAYACARALDAQPGETVIDVCAAPGGKTFTIAEKMHNCGIVYAFDLYEKRVGLIKDGAQRLGLSVVQGAVNDALQHRDDLPAADRVICDVPCSGFGVIRRKPEIKFKNLDDIKELPETQYQILTVSAAYVKNGGTLLYATCTLNKKENEKVVTRFLADNSGFRLKTEKTIIPSADGGDGFYYAVMERIYD